MELRLYWSIICRRLWLVVGLVVIVLASYLLTMHKAAPTYTAGMRFVVGLKPEPTSGGYYTYDRYYTWLTAEYLLDDFAEVVKSRAFAQDVTALAGIDVPVGAIQSATSAGKLHRILSITISWPDAQELTRIANAFSEVLLKQGDKYFAQLATGSGMLTLIDPPSISQAGSSLRQRLDLPLRLALALVAGIGLAFLLDYLDDTIRHQADLAKLGLPILGEIPSQRTRWTRPWRRRALP
jgi:capsular polysaccharide biosynthesis protein